jgi:hypothetical protein
MNALHLTRAMRCRQIALEHEMFRVMRIERCGPRLDRLQRMLAQALLAGEGLVIRTINLKYPDHYRPLRDNRGPH